MLGHFPPLRHPPPDRGSTICPPHNCRPEFFDSVGLIPLAVNEEPQQKWLPQLVKFAVLAQVLVAHTLDHCALLCCQIIELDKAQVTGIPPRRAPSFDELHGCIELISTQHLREARDPVQQHRKKHHKQHVERRDEDGSHFEFSMSILVA